MYVYMCGVSEAGDSWDRGEHRVPCSTQANLGFLKNHASKNPKTKKIKTKIYQNTNKTEQNIASMIHWLDFCSDIYSVLLLSSISCFLFYYFFLFIFQYSLFCLFLNFVIVLFSLLWNSPFWLVISV